MHMYITKPQGAPCLFSSDNLPAKRCRAPLLPAGIVSSVLMCLLHVLVSSIAKTGL